MQLAHTIGLLGPDAPTLQRQQPAKGAGLALGVHPHHGHFAAHAGNVAWQHITLRTRRTHLAHRARLQQGRQGA